MEIDSLKKKVAAAKTKAKENALPFCKSTQIQISKLLRKKLGKNMECILSPHIFSRLIKEEEKVQNKSSFCSFSLPRASLESHRRGFVVYIVVVLLLLSKKGDKQKEQKRQLSSNCDKSCSK